MERRFDFVTFFLPSQGEALQYPRSEGGGRLPKPSPHPLRLTKPRSPSLRTREWARSLTTPGVGCISRLLEYYKQCVLIRAHPIDPLRVHERGADIRDLGPSVDGARYRYNFSPRKRRRRHAKRTLHGGRQGGRLLLS